MSTMNVVDLVPSPSFAGHETFTLRYGWLKKAVDATKADHLVFTLDNALVTLGVGKNMVRSIRHWGLATGVLEEDPSIPNNRGRSIRPSALGKLIFGRGGLDPYLEDPGTLWLLHWHLTAMPEGPTTWYWAFNHCSEVEFTKDRIIHQLQNLVEQAGWSRIAPSSLQRDVDVFLRTYVPSRATRHMVLEETLDCPLAELGLIHELDGGRSYGFSRGDHPSLPIPVVCYAALQFWDHIAPQRQTLTFDEIAYRPGSPGRVFKLSEGALTDYLEGLESLTNRAIGYDVTAGLRQLYRRKPVNPIDLLRTHYTAGATHG